MHFSRCLVSAAIASVGIGFLNAPAFAAQASDGHAKFEVASIKPAAPGTSGTRSRFTPGGTFTASNISLKELIATMWRIPEFQISGGPAWLGSARYDISAKPENAPKDDEILPMAQSLLMDRFKLSVHRETKELPIFALVVARKDGRLGVGLGQSTEADCAAPDPSKAPDRPVPGKPSVPSCGRINRSPRLVRATSISLSVLAQSLSEILGRTVVDKTGLTGNFNITMEWTPDDAQPPDAPGPRVDASGPSIFAAIQEQLGLRLESQKGAVEVLVVDRAEKPSEN
jgi:uncharacterized protein (TIGR03435 family)